MYQTNNINETELVYSLLREKYPTQQIDISYNYDNKKYTLNLSESTFKEDPEIKVDFFTRVIYGDTDSIFVEIKFNREDFNLNRKDTFKLASICGDNITDVIFNRQPICLEFEKVFQPFILLTKKRYIGKKYEDTRDPFKLKTITNSGTAVTRRDFSKMVKDCYKEIIDCMVNQGNSDSAQEGVEIYKRYIDQLDAYQIDIDDLITSKTLAKSYSCALCKKKSEWIHLKCEEKDKKGKICGAESPLGSINCIKCKKPFNCIHKFNLVHVQLAIKMLKRKDEANINDRIPFIFIESDDRTLAKNDLGEDPVYVKKHNLKYNRSFYLESLGKTILAFLKICLNDYPSLLDEAIEYTNEKFDSYGSKRLKPSDFKLDNQKGEDQDE
jgi:DNA polymerase elongation subunit (family B)